MPKRSITSFLAPQLDKINDQLKHDRELREAFSSAATSEELQNFAFAITAVESTPGSHSTKHESILVLFRCPSPGSESFQVSITSKTQALDDQNAHASDAVSFALNAKPEHWEQFFQTDLSNVIRPFQSYWGMLRVIGSDNQVFISGDTAKFARYARVWRITLDRIRLVITRQVYNASIPDIAETTDEDDIEDSITGAYIWIFHNAYGKVKIFYEYSGNGPQPILFLHTAGSDSRQYHSLMNNTALQAKCTMYAFDLPGHGRSSLGTTQSIDTYALTEADYIESIDRILLKIRKRHGSDSLKNLIASGASMAGHICLALAIHTTSSFPSTSNRDTNTKTNTATTTATKTLHTPIRGVIPLEGTAHLPTPAAIYNLGSTSAPPSLLDPEKVCGMISPTSPEYFKRQIWWQYSSQANGVFAGDLRFYFKGWDGRGRLEGEGVDTGWCPAYMLTGEYDYSCTWEASQETAKGIGKGKGKEGDGGGGEGYAKGVMFERMEGLGHFPLTESPERVLPYLERAIEFIQRERRG